MNRLALFDCDGTLLDSQAVICRAMAATFTGFGRPAPGETDVRRIIGLSLPQAMAWLAPDADPLALADRYKRVFHGFRAAGEVEEPLFAGVVDALDRLEADGWLLGVATGKSLRGVTLALAHHGLGHRFVTLQTADHHPSKPHPSMIEAAMAAAGAAPATTIMIGDTSYDMAMARAAGCRAIGVAWGCHPPGELLAAGADAVVADPADLPHLMLETA